MSAHGHQLNEDMLRALPSRISQVMQGMLVSIGIASMAISIAGEWYHGHHFLNSWLLDNAPTLGAVLNLLLVSVAVFPGRIRPLHGDVDDPIARNAIQCINEYCLPALNWFWRCLGFVYVIQLYRTIAPGGAHESTVFADPGMISAALPSMLLEVSSAGSTFSILLTYAFLTPSFLNSQLTAGHAHGEPSTPWLKLPLFWKCLFAVVAVSGVALVLRMTMFQTDCVVAMDNVATCLNGVSSAVALAFFVGRMDSKFVLNWQWCVPLLFFYAGIQVYSSVLYSPDNVRQAVYIYAAFTLKCVLFIFVSNLFETRRLLYYAVALYHDMRREL